MKSQVHHGFTVVVDGEQYGSAVTLAEAKLIAGDAWEAKDRTQVWQNDGQGGQLNDVNHAGSKFVR